MIKVNYNKSIFESNNGYLIGLFKLIDTDEEELKHYKNKIVTCTGYFDDIKKDATYIFKGIIVDHPKYGVQYQVNEYEFLKPDSIEGIVEFLSSDLFKGIGPTLALSIVETLGLDAIDLILEQKENLLLVPKITVKKMNLIYNMLLKYGESHKNITYLTKIGFNTKDAVLIYNKYNNETINTIENNIFCLYYDLDISFTKLDKISSNMDIDKYDKERIKTLIIYIFKQITLKTGDTYFYYDELKKQIIMYLREELDISDYINELILENKIIKSDNLLYLKEIYDNENTIIDRINYLTKIKDNKEYKNIIDQVELGNNIKYNQDQLMAIIESLRNNISIITGGPGTGKTTIIKAIVDTYLNINNYEYVKHKNDIVLVAPTGRAAKRIGETTCFSTSTIHRFLKWNKETDEYMVNEFNKSNASLVIVDEFSMVDINLFSDLLKGLNKNAKIILVGDHNQLPSVGPGNLLKDLILSDKIKTIYLEQLYRQSDESYIPYLANYIKNDEIELSHLNQTKDFTFIETNNIVDCLKDVCSELELLNTQVLIPIYATKCGIDNINKELQNIYNPNNKLKQEIKYGDMIFRENDKVIQLVNMPDENIFNGDIGIIKFIFDEKSSDSKKKEIYVEYDYGTVKYLPNDFDKISLAYAISIHKSQGSEFDNIIMPISYLYNRMLYKKLIYTGITRAKTNLIIIGSKEMFINSCKNNRETVRKTNLLARLK